MAEDSIGTEAVCTSRRHDNCLDAMFCMAGRHSRREKPEVSIDILLMALAIFSICIMGIILGNKKLYK